MLFWEARSVADRQVARWVAVARLLEPLIPKATALVAAAWAVALAADWAVTADKPAIELVIAAA